LLHNANSNRKSRSGDPGDSETASDNSGRLKVAAAGVLTGFSCDFGPSNIMKIRIGSMESCAHYFPKGYGRPPAAESVPEPRVIEAIVFDDLIAVGLRMPPHLVLIDILYKLRQLHHLMLNAIVTISKFIWAVTSCRGHPTADVFAQHYEPHYQNNKIHLEGCETTLIVQFGCITFHLSHYRGWAELTLTVRNKWTSGWDSHWFYYRVPSEELPNVRDKGSYSLRSTVAPLDYLNDSPFECGSEDEDVETFFEATSIIGGRDAVEEFLISGIWPLTDSCGF
jgi:hypothetical protein